VKAYNRNIQNNLMFTSGTFTTGGVSMQFTHSFNRFTRAPKPGVRIPFLPPDSTRQDAPPGCPAGHDTKIDFRKRSYALAPAANSMLDRVNAVVEMQARKIEPRHAGRAQVVHHFLRMRYALA
jgi:hypothetical protein